MTNSLKKLITCALVTMTVLSASLSAEEGRESVFSRYPSTLGYNTVFNETDQYTEGLFYRHLFENIGLNASLNLYTGNRFRGIMEFTAGAEHPIAEASFHMKNEKIDEYVDSMLFFWYEGGYRNVTILEDSGYPEITPSGFILGTGLGLDIVFMDHLSAMIKIGYRAIFPLNTQIAFTTCSGLQYRF